MAKLIKSPISTLPFLFKSNGPQTELGEFIELIELVELLELIRELEDIELTKLEILELVDIKLDELTSAIQFC